MELPRRERGDELLKPEAMLNIRQRLRKISHLHDLTTVIACAFDHRTSMLPFVYADTRMAPAGARAIGSALFDCGFEKTRIVLQQWNRNFRPLHMRLDGRIPDIFMVSSMQIHSGQSQALIRDACNIDPAHRPLIIAGGPKYIYEPWDAFSADPLNPWSADIAVTGEEFVVLNLLEVLLSQKGNNESIRTAFLRIRNSSTLDEIPGLVYAKTNREGAAEELLDTGIQRLLGDLDELPSPVPGYKLLEPPSRKTSLNSRPLEAGKVSRYSPISSIVLTLGCKFACEYCPIPAYNQRQYRKKSGQRIALELSQLHQEYGLKYFFGADDNFFNNNDHTLSIADALARTVICGIPLRKRIRWGTEVTVRDTLAMKPHLRMIRQAGVRALWIGVEDMTATLINKGQSVSKTNEAFRLLLERGINPMPMIIHHDAQPLISRGPQPHGLLNQARLLRKAGAVSLQVLMITPAVGSRIYSQAFTSGQVYKSVAGRQVEPYMLDANYVIASSHKQPWKKQFNIMLAYLYFYNPLRLTWGILRPKGSLYLSNAGMQIIGMWGLAKTIRRTLGWALRLLKGNIVVNTNVPISKIPMRNTNGETASHALPGTPLSRILAADTKSSPNPEQTQKN